MDNLQAVNTEEALRQVLALGEQGSGLDVTFDQLKLLGAVIGMVTLLQIAAYSTDDKAKASAAKVLVDLKEDPAEIVDRLRAAPFHDLTMKGIKYVIDQMSLGRTDMEAMYKEARGQTLAITEQTDVTTG